MSIDKSKFLYFGLDEHSMELLLRVCEPTKWIELFPLDKGLSGSKVLMGRWLISDIPSKFHVFKIGSPKKLHREFEAISKIAAPLVRNFPNVTYEVSSDGEMAILSQEFMGDSDGTVTSLKQYIERADSPFEVATILERLYVERILDWIPKDPSKKTSKLVCSELGDWIKKGNLTLAIEEIGDSALRRSLNVELGFALDALEKLVDMVFKSTVAVETGPVHGDLHSQNIVINEKGEISLIDFGWTATRWRAIDYLWLECSLKFVVSSPYIPLSELLAMEVAIDHEWANDEKMDLSQFDNALNGANIKKIALGVSTIRINAKKHLQSISLSDYKKGLVAMMYALTTFPQLNRVHLIHSIARNCQSLVGLLRGEGPYQRLYESTTLLWPNRPGRMVKKAIQHMRDPGLALDVGCGDGKDFVFLEDAAWTVDGFDICSVAIDKIQLRIDAHFGRPYKLRSKAIRADATKYNYPTSKYDLALAYGLYHCLDDDELSIVHNGIVSSLKPGGLLAFAAFNNNLPIPEGHETGRLYMRDQNHIFQICRGSFEILDSEIGIITESHEPLVAEHKHGLTWALLRKI
jgi:SAM-dependent methyltransferase